MGQRIASVWLATAVFLFFIFFTIAPVSTFAQSTDNPAVTQKSNQRLKPPSVRIVVASLV